MVQSSNPQNTAWEPQAASFVLGTCVYRIAHRSVLQSLRQAYQTGRVSR
jgi:hypothetical protein